ncbi:hypothetical protein [Streptosporangium subroseum]|uniref:hypothetical protein n=1 Tax=Streptosporangium subroseum TaxID=106412 RepID=UPI003084ECBD|nr:hypothetical protein OHB15_28605 [Streptosporangium subroseum]
MREDMTYYRDLLAEEPWAEVSACWTVIRPSGNTATSRDVVTLLAEKGYAEAEPHTPKDMPLDGVLVWEQHGTICLFERYGSLGLPYDLPEWLSESEAYSLFWDVESNTKISHVRNSKLVAVIDPMEPDDRSGPLNDELRRALRFLEETARDHEDDWQAAALATIETVTGRRLSREWSRERHTCLVPGSPAAENHSITEHRFVSDAELDTALTNASGDIQADAFATLATTLVDRFDLREFPVVAELMTDLPREMRAPSRREVDVREGLIWPLAERFHAGGQAEPFEADPVWRRMQGGEALAIVFGAALSPGGWRDRRDALYHAQLAFGDEWSVIRVRLADQIRSGQPPE